MKYKGNLSTNLRFPQNDKNALTTFLHSTDDMQSFFKPKFIEGCNIRLDQHFLGHTVYRLLSGGTQI